MRLDADGTGGVGMTDAETGATITDEEFLEKASVEDFGMPLRWRKRTDGTYELHDEDDELRSEAVWVEVDGDQLTYHSEYGDDPYRRIGDGS